MGIVGRDPQRAQLSAWLAARAAGHAQAPPVLLVSGEAGIGKTALVSAVVPAGTPWASAAPWRPAPLALVRQLTDGDLHEFVSAAGVVVLDDLHWADDASLELLAPLADAVASDPVAVIGVYRADELPRGHLLRRVRAQLRHRRRLTELALGPLDLAGVAALIRQVTGEQPTAAQVAAVAERTEGIPFFVEELVAVADSPELPDTVRDAVLLRASHLSENARDALDRAAVIGVEFPVPDGWPDDLDHSGLVVAGEGARRRFRHALIQEALYAEIPWSRRRALHLAAAEELSASGAAYATVARHLLEGHDHDRARSVLVSAADEFIGVHAYRDAARLLRKALEIWPTGPSTSDETSGEAPGADGRRDAVERLTMCAELSGDHATAVTGLRELLDDSTDPRLYRRLAVQYELQGHWPPALAARESAATAFLANGDRGDAAAERLAVAAHLRSAASFAAALDVLAQAEPDAAAAGRSDLQCRIEGLRGNVLARMGQSDDGLAVLKAALEKALANGLTVPAGEIYQRLADSLEHAGDYRGARKAYDSAYEFCQINGQDMTSQLCRACATVVLFQSGRWDQALAACAKVLAMDAIPHSRAAAAGVSGLIHALRGKAPSARAALLESRAIAVRIELTAMEMLSTWGLALLDEAGGRTDRAAESYRHVVARCQATEERHYCVLPLQFAAARFAADGARGDLGAVAALLADAVARTGQPEARAAFAYVLGESALAEGEPATAVPHLRQAVDLLDGLGLPIAETLVRRRTADALRSAGQPDADLRGEADRIAYRLKAGMLAGRTPVSLTGTTPVNLLSPREDEVLRLVGQGLTNREIGERLFLSVRTVEMHVRNAIAKLGCRTRAEAVQRLTRSGAGSPS